MKTHTQKIFEILVKNGVSIKVRVPKIEQTTTNCPLSLKDNLIFKSRCGERNNQSSGGILTLKVRKKKKKRIVKYLLKFPKSVKCLSHRIQKQKGLSNSKYMQWFRN